MRNSSNTPGGCYLYIPFVVVTIILGVISYASLQMIMAGLKTYNPKNQVEAVFVTDLYDSSSNKTKTVEFTYDGKIHTDRANFSEYHKVGEKIKVYLNTNTMSVSEPITPLIFVVFVPILLGAVGFWLFMYKRIIVEKGRNVDWSADDD